MLMEQHCVAGLTSDIMQPDLLESAFKVAAEALRQYCESPQPDLSSLEAQRDCRRRRSDRHRRFGRRT
jgi:hypothetical protein